VIATNVAALAILLESVVKMALTVVDVEVVIAINVAPLGILLESVVRMALMIGMAEVEEDSLTVIVPLDQLLTVGQ